MKIFLIVFCMSAPSFARLCQPDDVYWLNHDSLFFAKKKLVDDLNPVILKVKPECKKLFPNCTWSPQFAKTKRHVFFKDRELTAADPASFEYICDDFGRDKYNVYKADQVFLHKKPQSFSYDEISGVYRFGKKAFDRDGKPVKSLPDDKSPDPSGPETK